MIKRAKLKLKVEFKKFQILNMNLKRDYFALFDPVGLELNEEWRQKWNINREEPEVVKFWRIFCVNSVNIGLVRTDVERHCDDLSGIYKQFSMINHSCSSNVTQDWKEENPLKIEAFLPAVIVISLCRRSVCVRLITPMNQPSVI